MDRSKGHGGLEIAWERCGSEPIRYLLVHATGFCKETWRPLLAGMGNPASLAIDQRGHGDSEASPPPFDWWDLARDVLAVLAGFPTEQPVGVGHSSGGAVALMAEILAPGTFSRIVAVEPIVPPPPYRRTEHHSLVEMALRRRSAFPGPAEAFAAYRARQPFSGWTEAALHSYVAHGFRRDESGWSLKCRPEVEAEFYRTSTAHGAWDRLGEVAAPVEVVIGEHSDSHPEPVGRALVDRFPAARLHVIEGATHFVPMERPDAMAVLLAAD